MDFNGLDKMLALKFRTCSVPLLNSVNEAKLCALILEMEKQEAYLLVVATCEAVDSRLTFDRLISENLPCRQSTFSKLVLERNTSDNF